jgi:hypothetical protein
MYAYTKNGERLEFPNAQMALRRGDRLLLLDSVGNEIDYLELHRLSSYGRVRVISERSLRRQQTSRDVLAS